MKDEYYEGDIKMLIEHKYKGFNIVKTGTKKYPWNIYKDDGHGFGKWVGYGETLSGCKMSIDDGCYDDYETFIAYSQE